jgi:hypothetical protein
MRPAATVKRVYTTLGLHCAELSNILDGANGLTATASISAMPVSLKGLAALNEGC